MAFYGEDLARAHHEGYGDVARGGAATLIAALRDAGSAGGSVVDLGCGSGIAARVLGEAGYDVVGYDLSADMIALAREHAPRARFEQAPVWDAELPPCVAIASFGEVLSYAADPRAGRAELSRLLHRAHEALAPGGLLVFDLMVPTGDATPRFGGGEGDGWAVWAVAAEDPAARTLERRIVLFRRTSDEAGALYRRSDEVHVVRLYEPDEVLEDLAAAGFRAQRLDRYAGMAPFRAGVAGFLAAKPAP